jgi:hypothetical protein
MAKVIVERPRLGGTPKNKPKGARRKLRRLLDEGPPRHEGMRARWQGQAKCFNEHLGPLRRYLDSQVGRPWDEVFAEICAHINRNSVVQDHVRDHVADYVVTNVLLIDGVPCKGEGGYGYGEPLHRLFRRRRWYVCPLTGLLRRVEVIGKRRQRPPKKNPPRYIPLGDTMQCRFLDGGWHLVTLKPLPDPSHRLGRCGDRDILLDRPVAEITAPEARRHYGSAVYAVAKRRLARRELRQFPIPVDAWNANR